MRILVVHNRYQQRGGEDTVVSAESELLRARGHEVHLLEVNNDHIGGVASQIHAAAQAVYSWEGRSRVRAALQETRADLVHVHNTFPTLSPAIFKECVAEGVPAIQTLHNYRIQCATATLFRDGHVCEECVTERSFWPGVQHACYRGSRVGSAVSGASMALHDRLGTWKHAVAAYIALTPFAADKLGRFRLPREKIHVKPNFAADQGVGEGGGGYALFIGRLTPEKGLGTLVEADREDRLCMDVLVLGDGPMRADLEQAAARPGSRLKLKGYTDRSGTLSLLKGAEALLMPSVWYDVAPMVVIEAYSTGLPVIACDMGSTGATIREQRTGLVYPPGDADGLAEALRWIAEHGSQAAEMRVRARGYYLAEHTPEINYARLMKIYEGVLRGARQLEVRIGSVGPQAMGIRVVGSLALVVAVVVVGLYLTVPKSNEGAGEVDALVVLGTPADLDGSLLPMQRWRVEEGVAEFRRGRGARIVFTGGAAANRFVEADVMAAYARALGVPAAAVFEERAAHTTIENVGNTAALARGHGWRTLEVVSSAEHLRRAAVLLEPTGLGWRVHAAPTPGRSRAEIGLAYAEEAVGTAALRVFGERSEPLLHAISLVQHRVAWGVRWVWYRMRSQVA